MICLAIHPPTCNLIKNIIPHSALPNGQSPYTLWMGNIPSLSTIQTFGCKATIAVPEKQHDKLSSHSITGVHLGLAIGKKAFIVYNPTTQRVHKSQDVHFFEGMPESKCVTIEVPDVDSPSHSHVKMKPLGIKVDADAEEEINGKDDGGLGKGSDEINVDVEVTSGQVPEGPCQSG